MRRGGVKSAAHRRLIALDAIGLVSFTVSVAVVGWGDASVNPSDLLVYHHAAAHLPTDDVYEHLYPVWPFTYPPSALLLMYGFGSAVPVARIAMFLASVVSVWVTIHLTVRSAAPASVWTRIGPVSLFSALTVISVPLILGTALGQIAPVIMGLSAVGTLGRRSIWNGFWVGTAVAIKLTPAVFVAWWWIIGRRNAAWGAILTVLAWTAAGAFVMPSSSRWYFLQGGVFRTDEMYAAGALNASNQSLTSVAARFGIESPWGRLLIIVLSAALLLCALVVARRVHAAGWTAAAVALVGVWSGVAAPVAFIHAFGWWVPLAVAIGLSGRRWSDVLVGVGVYFAPFLVLMAPWDRESVSFLSSLWASNFALLAILVTGWLWWRVPSASRSQASPVQSSPVVPTE